MCTDISLRADDLAVRLDGILEGDGTCKITTVATLNQATPNSLSWIGDRRYLSSVNGTRAGVILISSDCPPLPNHTIIRVADPDVALLHVLEWLTPPREGPGPGIDPSAQIHPEAKVSGAIIGANVYVAAGAVIGAGTRLHPGVHVGAMTRIGRDCELWPNVVMRERVTVGDRVIIHPNTTIGADGFGYLQRNGQHLKIPQIGTVVVEDDVEIGANCAIDRAARRCHTHRSRHQDRQSRADCPQRGHRTRLHHRCTVWHRRLNNAWRTRHARRTGGSERSRPNRRGSSDRCEIRCLQGHRGGRDRSRYSGHRQPTFSAAPSRRSPAAEMG